MRSGEAGEAAAGAVAGERALSWFWFWSARLVVCLRVSLRPLLNGARLVVLYLFCSACPLGCLGSLSLSLSLHISRSFVL